MCFRRNKPRFPAFAEFEGEVGEDGGKQRFKAGAFEGVTTEHENMKRGLLFNLLAWPIAARCSAIAVRRRL